MAEDASASAAAAVVSVCRESLNTSAGKQRAGRPQKDSLFTQPRVEKQAARASD